MLQRTIVVSSNTQPLVCLRRDEAVVVGTPLEAIKRLESGDIRTIILAGSYATNGEFADFIGAFYPRIRIRREV